MEQGTPIGVPSDRVRPAGFGRVMLTTLAVAVVAGVGEVMLRFARTTDDIKAPQLTLAAMANVATLGAAVLVLAAIAWPLVAFFARTRNRTEQVGPIVVALCLACAAAVTDVLSLVDRPVGVAVTAIGMAVLSYVVLRPREPNRSPRLSVLVCAGVALAWLVAVAFTGGTVKKTGAYVRGWTLASTAADVDSDERTPNIVVLMLDTLRADRVGVYGSSDLTPHMDALAESSVVYGQAISTAPWTLPAHASLFSGMYPEDHGVNWGHYELDDRWPLIGELLAQRGYDTFAVSNNWLLSKENGYDRGFAAFAEIWRDPVFNDWRLALQCGAVRRAGQLIGLSPEAGLDSGSAWTNWLLKHRLANPEQPVRPFFAFVNYFEPHDPYRPVPRLANARLTPEQRVAYGQFRQNTLHLAEQACGVPHVLTEAQVRLMSALYDVEIAYQDEAVGEVIDMLADAGRLEDTWVVVTSDHGELFGEGAGVYHVAGSDYQLLHVPLIVRPPGGVSPQRVESPVQPVDVFVTLVEAAGGVVPPSVTRAYALPLDVNEPGERRVAVAQSFGAAIASMAIALEAREQVDLRQWLTWVDSVFDGQHLLEVETKGPRALYDVLEDPAMRVNRLATSGDVATSLLSVLDRWQASAKQGENRWRWVNR